MQMTTPITDSAGAKSYFAKDDYYTKDASGSRAWLGKGSDSLGLDEVTPEAFQALLEGKDIHGNTLVTAASNGEHRAGWDLTFAPSKSFSVLWALGDEKQKADILASHEDAVLSTMKYVEENLIQARMTGDSGNTERVSTGNMVAARFDHFTSREMDPQLHTHVVVANITKRPDGEWRAVANEKIFNRELLTALYENELAANLKEKGHSIIMEKHDTGNSRYARIEGIDDKIIEHFSKRTDQIEKKITAMQKDYPLASRGELRQMACLDTRQPKKTIDQADLLQSWENQLNNLGYTREDLTGSVRMEDKTQIIEKQNPRELVTRSSAIVTEQESTFRQEDVIKIAARLSEGTYRTNELEDAFRKLKGSTILTLDKSAGTYTTREMKRIEKDIVYEARAGRYSYDPVMPLKEISFRADIFYPHLTQDQRKALEHIMISGDHVIGIQGDAGTGKTSMLNAAREELVKEGFTVRGLTFTGKAAKELETGAGVESKTLHSFLSKVNSPEVTLSSKEIWFVDEVSMVGSKQMEELMRVSKEAKARLVFVGDTKQLQSISAGRMFQILQETGAMETVHMKEVVRQSDENYKSIVADIAERKLDRAFKKMNVHKKLHEIADEGERKNAIVDKVTSKKDYKDVLVVTPLNRDRNELNAKIRDRLKESGKLKGQEEQFFVREHKVMSPAQKHFVDSYSSCDFVSTNGRIKGIKIGTTGFIIETDSKTQEITLYVSMNQKVKINVAKDGDKIKVYREKMIPLAQGDKVVFLQNDSRLKVQNGLTGEVKSIDHGGNIVVSTNDNKDVKFNIKYSYNYIDHGYAVTDYKSQGQTSKEVIFHANTEKSNSYNSFYVAATRGKKNVHVFTDNLGKLQEQVKQEVRKTSTLDKAPVMQKANLELPPLEMDWFDKLMKDYQNIPERGISR